MSHPGSPPPARSGRGAENAARAVAAAITLVALVAVVVIALATSDDADGAIGAEPGTSAGRASDSSGGGTVSTAPLPTQPVATAGTTPGADAFRDRFPLPPDTRRISQYGSIKIKPEPGENFYLTRTGLASVLRFYVGYFRGHGWITYIDPSIDRANGRITGYFYIWHLKDALTTDLSLDADYLGDAPGQVLIQAKVEDG